MTSMQPWLVRLGVAARTQGSFVRKIRHLSTSFTCRDDDITKDDQQIPVRRALMYLPGHDTRKTAKAATLNLDCVCLDLEDAVSPSRKPEARETVIRSLADTDFNRADVAVRVNPVSSTFFEDDLAALFASEKMPDTIVVPKMDTLAEMDHLFESAEQLRTKSTPHIRLLMQVESPLSLINLQKLLEFNSNEDTESLTFNLEGVIFGGDDYAAALGARRTSNNRELLYARQAVVTHAKAFGLQAIDVVNINFKNEHQVFAEAKEGADFGFTGKQVIHPMQVPIVQRAFTPTEDEVTRAINIINAHNEHEHSEEGGAFAFEGQMIDTPTIRQCENVLSMARIDGTLEESRLLTFDKAEQE